MGRAAVCELVARGEPALSSGLRSSLGSFLSSLDSLMSLTYFKRFRMELDLRNAPPMMGPPAGYRLVSWTPERLDQHAETKFQAFRHEIDAQLFGCLASRDGCLQLMTEISRRPGFLPEATWLLESHATPHKPEFCGTIQGVRATPRYGAIQNVGVIAEHRGRRLGRVLVTAALLGFQQAGLRRAYLEVTAENENALQLYRNLGFRRVRTLYKAVDLAYT